MSEVKTVSNDPHIPKAKKKAMLEQILKRTYAIEKNTMIIPRRRNIRQNRTKSLTKM